MKPQSSCCVVALRAASVGNKGSRNANTCGWTCLLSHVQHRLAGISTGVCMIVCILLFLYDCDCTPGPAFRGLHFGSHGRLQCAAMRSYLNLHAMLPTSMRIVWPLSRPGVPACLHNATPATQQTTQRLPQSPILGAAVLPGPPASASPKPAHGRLQPAAALPTPAPGFLKPAAVHGAQQPPHSQPPAALPVAHSELAGVAAAAARSW